jgi:hypothetical protein
MVDYNVMKLILHKKYPLYDENGIFLYKRRLITIDEKSSAPCCTFFDDRFYYTARPQILTTVCWYGEIQILGFVVDLIRLKEGITK